MSGTIRIILSIDAVFDVMRNNGLDVSKSAYYLHMDFLGQYLRRLIFNEDIAEESLIQKLMTLNASHSIAEETYIAIHDCFGCNLVRILAKYNDGYIVVDSFKILDTKKIEILLKEMSIVTEVNESNKLDKAHKEYLEGVENGDYFDERSKRLFDALH